MNCAKCGHELSERVSKTASNPGRPFRVCDQRKGGCGWFAWSEGKKRPAPTLEPQDDVATEVKRLREVISYLVESQRALVEEVGVLRQLMSDEK